MSHIYNNWNRYSTMSVCFFKSTSGLIYVLIRNYKSFIFQNIFFERISIAIIAYLNYHIIILWGGRLFNPHHSPPLPLLPRECEKYSFPGRINNVKKTLSKMRIAHGKIWTFFGVYQNTRTLLYLIQSYIWM